MPHAHAFADVIAPPRRLLMPARQPIGRVRDHSAVLQPLNMRAVKAGMRSVKEQQAARREDSTCLGQYGAEVVNIGRDPECHYGRERTVSKWERGSVALDDLP